MLKHTLALAALVLLPASALAQAPDRPPQPQPRNTLVVYGRGETNAAPDVAYFTIGVVTEARRAQEASQSNAALTTKVMAALKAQGIADRDLQTSSYSVQPKYENLPNREPRIVGYQVSNQIRATLRNLKKAGEIIDAATEAGSNSVFGPSFALEARAEAESRALEQAVAEARRKAEVMARAAGVRLGAIAELHEGTAVRVPMMETRGDMAMMRSAAVSTPIVAGELTVTANVTIVYQIQETPRAR